MTPAAAQELKFKLITPSDRLRVQQLLNFSFANHTADVLSCFGSHNTFLTSSNHFTKLEGGARSSKSKGKAPM
ncbi:hypothetical protein L1987_61401 [Smallanthus sonchifolius]|uniref:Uncharacterized protein n=1 Tax=Smallanthus sonchifolius TaxID=185202 RepID=A0ACB9C7E4_9ASTR|nr:hypothetical protein L1987_61401 [Smallanthus sonchifolius]